MTLETDTAYGAVDYVETYTGRAFWPGNPKVEDVSIIDIAHHLSNQCRYSGATSQLYSTAQHCCLLSNYVEATLKGSPLDCLQILMHDAAEAYLIDLPRPIKQHLPEFRLWDRNIQMCVRSWLGIGDEPIPSWQDEIDSRIISDERAQLLSDSGLDWKHSPPPLGIRISPWLPPIAEQQFLMRYASYMQRIHGTHQYLRSAWGIPMHSRFTRFPFQTKGSDTAQYGPSDPTVITDLVEVDIRGKVGRVAVRSPDGMMMRDTSVGSFPRPAWKWIRGDFELSVPGVHDVKLGTHEKVPPP
jgi:hypothetical protein